MKHALKREISDDQAQQDQKMIANSAQSGFCVHLICLESILPLVHDLSRPAGAQCELQCRNERQLIVKLSFGLKAGAVFHDYFFRMLAVTISTIDFREQQADLL